MITIVICISTVDIYYMAFFRHSYEYTRTHMDITSLSSFDHFILDPVSHECPALLASASEVTFGAGAEFPLAAPAATALYE